MSEQEKFFESMNSLINVFIPIFLIVLFVTSIWFGVDDTDDCRFNRSGMMLRIDHGTGIEYLESTGGHLIPRLYKDDRSSSPH